MPSYAEYKKRMDKQRRDHESKELDETYNMVDRNFRKQKTWHGKRSVNFQGIKPSVAEAIWGK